MKPKSMLADRIGGVVAVVIGLVAMYEAFRLYPRRLSEYAGDHILFGLLGTIMILLGLLLIFVVKIPPYKVEFPRGPIRNVLLAAIGLLAVYRIAIPFFGYLASTFIVSCALFKVLGGYRWHLSTLFAAVLLGCFYAVFILWLQMSFPAGLLEM